MSAEQQQSPPQRQPVAYGKRHSGFLPLLLLTLVVNGFIGFLVWQLWQEHGQLVQVREQQQQTTVKARQVRTQIDSIATQTARLAADGNANAIRLVELLRQRGVTINADNGLAPGRSGSE